MISFGWVRYEPEPVVIKPKEGDTKCENYRTYIWTTRKEGTIAISEWVEKPIDTYYEINYTI